MIFGQVVGGVGSELRSDRTRDEDVQRRHRDIRAALSTLESMIVSSFEYSVCEPLQRAEAFEAAIRCCRTARVVCTHRSASCVFARHRAVDTTDRWSYRYDWQSAPESRWKLRQGAGNGSHCRKRVREWGKSKIASESIPSGYHSLTSNCPANTTPANPQSN